MRKHNLGMERFNPEEMIEVVMESIGKIDAFGMGMREVVAKSL